MSAPRLPDGRQRREVLSYVRRTDRMTESQERAWTRSADRYLVDLPDLSHTAVVDSHAPLDLPEVFGRDAELIVEIGPGMGDSLVPMAAARTDRNVLAFEVYRAGAAAIMQKCDAAGVDNIRVVMADAASGLRNLLAPDTIAELWTFFPDPWHKLRHRKRRLINTDFADVVASRLTPDGLWRLATDWSEYATQMRRTLDAHPLLVNVHSDAGGWAPRWSERPITRFEQRGIDAGRRPHDLTYRRAAP